VRTCVCEFPTGLVAEDAVAMRKSMAPRGCAFVMCSASAVVSTWLSLRAGGLEPKRTVFAFPDVGSPASHAIIVCKPAKHGGMSVDIAVIDDGTRGEQ